MNKEEILAQIEALCDQCAWCFDYRPYGHHNEGMFAVPIESIMAILEILRDEEAN